MCITVLYCSKSVFLLWRWGRKITVFCHRESIDCLQHVLSKFEAVVYCLQASISPSWARSDSDNGRNQTVGFFDSRNRCNLRGCAGVAATGSTRPAHHCTYAKEMLLLPDSHYITSPLPRLGNVHTIPSETEELQNFPSLSPSALTREPTTLAFFNGACVLCYKPQGSLPHETAWVSCSDCSCRR